VGKTNLIITHRKNLLNKYGKYAAEKILKAISQLVNVKNAELYLIDELKGVLNKFDFKNTVEPAKLKSFFDKIDSNSKNKLDFLIIGGHSIIPFYKMENPADDQDRFLLTDAPYASSDNDYLIPQRAFGRIPDSSDEKPDFLLHLLRQTKDYHNKLKGYDKSFGYTASVWKEASKAVFRVVGDTKQLKISPPCSAKKLKKNWLKKQCLYFNLHGSKASPNWYGQRAADDIGNSPAYPVAITPESVPSLVRSIIYSEACYGAWIFEKSKDESMALRFLDRGSIAFVGSTAIAYGPPHPPLTEADLLGKYFLQYVEKGIPFGDALKNAKVDFAKKMLRTQGFLDDDDKKTLLEFQLYGDPSLSLSNK